MVEREVKPLTEGNARPPRGNLTWIALGAILLFVVALVAVFVRPVLARHDGPAQAPPGAEQPALPAT